MSETYYLLAAISYGIFIVQFILSWFGGDSSILPRPTHCVFFMVNMGLTVRENS